MSRKTGKTALWQRLLKARRAHHLGRHNPCLQPLLCLQVPGLRGNPYLPTPCHQRMIFLGTPKAFFCGTTGQPSLSKGIHRSSQHRGDCLESPPSGEAEVKSSASGVAVCPQHEASKAPGTKRRLALDCAQWGETWQVETASANLWASPACPSLHSLSGLQMKHPGHSDTRGNKIRPFFCSLFLSSHLCKPPSFVREAVLMMQKSCSHDSIPVHISCSTQLLIVSGASSAKQLFLLHRSITSSPLHLARS